MLNSLVLKFVNEFSDPKHSGVSDDEKLMVGTVILDYLQQMLDDPYVFEKHFLDLILNLHIKKTGQAQFFKVVELICYDLKQYLPRLFNIIVRRLAALKADLVINHKNYTEPQMPLLSLVATLFQKEPFLQAILQSKTINSDLELLFGQCVFH